MFLQFKIISITEVGEDVLLFSEDTVNTPCIRRFYEGMKPAGEFRYLVTIEQMNILNDFIFKDIGFKIQFDLNVEKIESCFIKPIKKIGKFLDNIEKSKIGEKEKRELLKIGFNKLLDSFLNNSKKLNDDTFKSELIKLKGNSITTGVESFLDLKEKIEKEKDKLEFLIGYIKIRLSSSSQINSFEFAKLIEDLSNSYSKINIEDVILKLKERKEKIRSKKMRSVYIRRIKMIEYMIKKLKKISDYSSPDSSDSSDSESYNGSTGKVKSKKFDFGPEFRKIEFNKDKVLFVDIFTGKYLGKEFMEIDHIQPQKSIKIRAKREISEAFNNKKNFRKFVKKFSKISGKSNFSVGIRNTYFKKNGNLDEIKVKSQFRKKDKRMKKKWLKDYTNYLLADEENKWLLSAGTNRSLKSDRDFFSWLALEIFDKALSNLVEKFVINRKDKKELMDKLKGLAYREGEDKKSTNSSDSSSDSSDSSEEDSNEIFKDKIKYEIIEEFISNYQLKSLESYLGYLSEKKVKIKLDDLKSLLISGSRSYLLKSIITSHKNESIVRVGESKMKLGTSLRRWFIDARALEFRVSRFMAINDHFADGVIKVFYSTINDAPEEDRKELVNQLVSFVLNLGKETLDLVKSMISNIEYEPLKISLKSLVDTRIGFDSLDGAHFEKAIVSVLGNMNLNFTPPSTPEKNIDKSQNKG